MTVGWRVEMWKLGMARKAHEDFERNEFDSAMAYAENAGKRFAHVAISPITSPDRVRNPINTECVDCPVCGGK